MTNEIKPRLWPTKLLVNISLSGLSLLLTLTVLELSFRIHEIHHLKSAAAWQSAEDSWCQYDPLLGWKHIPNKMVPQAYYDHVPVVINSTGVRADREYEPGGKRILAVGCSFTFGHNVEGKYAWPQQLENKLKAVGFEYDVINAGVNGYGIDQAYLLFLEKQKLFKPDIVILAFPDTLDRLVRCRWTTGQGKPRYRLVMNELVLTNVPVPQRIPIGKHFTDWANILLGTQRSYFADFLTGRLFSKNPSDKNRVESLQIAQKLILKFSQQCNKNGAKFLVVFINRQPELEKFLSEKGVAFTDCSESLNKEKDAYIPYEGHPTNHGHELIAKQVHMALAANGDIR